jgi:serine/threonine-protein kinase RsbW
MTEPRELVLSLRSNPRYLCAVREFVAQIGRSLGFGEAGCCQIALAVDEALTNVIKHGYEKRLDGPITLALTPLPDEGSGPGVQIVIEDEARQVPPDQIKGRDLADVRPGGLGVHIIREVMDQVVYERREHAGMRLTMLKRIRPDSTNPCASWEGGK